MNRRIDIDEVRQFISEQPENTKVYIGGDSERFKVDGVFYADYMTVIIVHIGGKHGCRIFGEVVRERDFDQKKNRPRFRLMNEVYKISEMYLKLSEVLDDMDVEIHLDINPDEKHGSSCVITEAIGYIKGTCMVTPLVKPQSWAASHAADRFKGIKRKI